MSSVDHMGYGNTMVSRAALRMDIGDNVGILCWAWKSNLQNTSKPRRQAYGQGSIWVYESESHLYQGPCELQSF